MSRIGEAERVLQKCVTVPLSQTQTDALISFLCNVGAEAFQRSTLLQLLNKRDLTGAELELRKWTKARQNGVVVDVPALVTRRNAEAELFRRDASPGTALASSLSTCRYEFHSPSPVVTQQSGHYSQAQSPMIAGIAIADAAQIGLAGVSVVQAQVSATQGSFSLSFDKAQRLLTSEARAQMPGAQVAKKSYSTRLFEVSCGRIGTAEAEVIIVWEGNPHGEIGTPIIRRNLSTSTEWSKSSASFVITKLDRIPLPNTDPRTWPIAYTYEGSYDPLGNGHWEFSGEFEVNAFGGLKFTRHEVVSRSLIDLTLLGKPESYVAKGKDVIVAVPDVPAEQLAYLKTKLP
jgi:hypothetical protein